MRMSPQTVTGFVHGIQYQRMLTGVWVCVVKPEFASTSRFGEEYSQLPDGSPTGLSKQNGSCTHSCGHESVYISCAIFCSSPTSCRLKIAVRPHSIRYTSALRREKRARRRGEGVAARTQLEVDRHIVPNMHRRRNEQLVEAKSTYFTNKVEESKDDLKALFRLTRNMMGNSGDKILPVHTCKRKLAKEFSAFFTNKILNIMSELGLTDTHTGQTVFLEFH